MYTFDKERLLGIQKTHMMSKEFHDIEFNMEEQLTLRDISHSDLFL